MVVDAVAVVTGANKGIGYAIVKELCSKFSGTVYLTARDEKRGKEAVQQLQQIGLSASFQQLNIGDKESIKKFAEYIKTSYGGLDILVNNAAVGYIVSATEPFSDQAENTVRINYFGTLDMCHALFPLLRPHARVVNISSSAGHLSRINGWEPSAANLRKKFASDTLTEEELGKLMAEFVRFAREGTLYEHGWPNSAYVASKVGVSALTRIQQRSFDVDMREDLVVNSCHPGYVATDLSSHRGQMTTEEGAVCPTYLALLQPNIEGPRGSYVWFDKCVTDWVKGCIPQRK